MIKFIAFFLLSVSLFAENDIIVAVVNDDIITRSEIITDLETFKKGNPNARNVNINLVLPELLEQRVLHTLQLQKIKSFNIKARDYQIKQQVENIARSNKLTLAQLKITLNKQQKNGYKTLIKNINTKIALQILRNEVTKSKSFIADEEIDFELKIKNLALYSYEIGNIFIAKPKKYESLEKYKQKLALIYQILDKKRATFKQIAHSFSDAKNAKSYGQMGALTISNMPSVYKRVLTKLKIGQISKLIRSSDGTHIIKLYKKNKIENKEQKQTKISHILFAPHKGVSKKQAKKQAEKIYKILQKKPETFELLAKKHSRDVSSRNNGGSLGWVKNQDIHPEFLKNLKKVISKPFKTEFGWHLAKKIDERNVNLTLEKQREEIKNYLRRKKGDEIYAIWLENLRAGSYIKLFKDKL